MTDMIKDSKLNPKFINYKLITFTWSHHPIKKKSIFSISRSIL